VRGYAPVTDSGERPANGVVGIVFFPPTISRRERFPEELRMTKLLAHMKSPIRMDFPFTLGFASDCRSERGEEASIKSPCQIQIYSTTHLDDAPVPLSMLKFADSQ
jgi:hypothetical protein